MGDTPHLPNTDNSFRSSSRDKLQSPIRSTDFSLEQTLNYSVTSIDAHAVTSITGAPHLAGHVTLPTVMQHLLMFPSRLPAETAFKLSYEPDLPQDWCDLRKYSTPYTNIS